MKKFLNHKLFIYFLLIFAYILIFLSGKLFINANASAFPFYDLNPNQLVLRSEFSTSFSSSTKARKHNIQLATKALDKTFVDVLGEFSFNYTVGPRTEKRGYQSSKIIVGGEFVDGVGGGVCQVSTTLYNALLLSGLKIVEYHPHSLPVSYVSPSFDAMVSFNFADLRFINDTHNPIIIRATANDNTVKIQIYGEPSAYTYKRESTITCQIPAPKEREVEDVLGEYPDLFIGQKQVVKYSSPGLKSEGYLIKYKNGKRVNVKRIRTDCYNAVQGLIILGKAPYPESEILPDTPTPLPE